MPSFPNEASIMRLIGAVLFEQNDEWQIASRYMMLEAFAQIDKEEMTPFSASQRKPPDHALRPSGKLHHLDGHDPQPVDQVRTGHTQGFGHDLHRKSPFSCDRASKVGFFDCDLSRVSRRISASSVLRGI